MAAEPVKRITDIGPPHYEKFLHPVIKKNYGSGSTTSSIAPGVLCHVAESGRQDLTPCGPARPAC